MQRALIIYRLMQNRNIKSYMQIVKRRSKNTKTEYKKSKKKKTKKIYIYRD